MQNESSPQYPFRSIRSTASRWAGNASGHPRSFCRTYAHSANLDVGLRMRSALHLSVPLHAQAWHQDAVLGAEGPIKRSTPLDQQTLRSV